MVIFFNFSDKKVFRILSFLFGLVHSALTLRILTSLNIKGKIFIIDVFRKIFSISIKGSFLIEYFKRIGIVQYCFSYYFISMSILTISFFIYLTS